MAVSTAPTTSSHRRGCRSASATSSRSPSYERLNVEEDKWARAVSALRAFSSARNPERRDTGEEDGTIAIPLLGGIRVTGRSCATGA